jgi:hypothetical protein
MADNGRQKGDLLLATAIAAGASVRDAAKQLGLGERTAYRRSTEPDFRALVTSIRAEMVSRATGKLAEAAADAAGTLLTLARDADSEPVRLSAAKAVLELGAQLRKVEDFDARLAEIEAGLKAQQRER